MRECNLCKERIRTEKDRYVHVEDWSGEKKVKEMWSHLKCFNKAMNRDLKELEKKASIMLDTAGNIFKNFQPKNKEYVLE